MLHAHVSDAIQSFLTISAFLPSAVLGQPIDNSAQMAQMTQWYPDLRAVVPIHLNLVNKQKEEILRFSNGVANTGDGHWRLRAGAVSPDGATQEAIQEIIDDQGMIQESKVVSNFAYHPAHRHFHIDAVAKYSIHQGSPDGPQVGDTGVKVTYCLIDWYKLEGNSPNHERNYSDCAATYQGVSPGWVDQYHHETQGQDIKITGIAPGLYYLVTTTNPDGVFVETDYSNNTAWTSFNLTRDSNGNPKIAITGKSECETSALCGEGAPNR